MTAGLLYGTVIFFLVMMALAIGIPMTYFIHEDHKKTKKIV